MGILKYSLERALSSVGRATPLHGEGRGFESLSAHHKFGDLVSQWYIPPRMAIQISPVDTEKRKALDIRMGDTVRVTQKIPEKGKFRLQIFEGLILARKHGKEAGGTFTVRRVLSGVGVEKIFPLYSPMIEKIEVVKRSTVRRAKLYYIREKVAREARRQLRHTRMMGGSVMAEEKLEAAAEGEIRTEAEPVAVEVGAEAKSE